MDSLSVIKTCRYSLLWTLVALIVILAIALSIPLLALPTNARWLSWFFFSRQDALFCIPFVGVLLFRPEVKQSHGLGNWLNYLTRPVAIYALAVLLIGVCWIGHSLVFLDYDLSRDAQMADFDAYIFAHGRLFWPLPSAWHPFAAALNQVFVLPIGNHEAWVSAYLPVNAAIRALVGELTDRSLASPFLVALGGLALWRVSVRLWPDSLSTRAVVLLLYAGSAQILVTGMTSYAMTGHLALDLVWLALFLEDRSGSHLGAVAVGFLATGLHQPLFHPMFILPFMGLLAARRRWRLLAFYGASYALIGAFWFLWPIWISSHGVGVIATNGGHGISFLTRLINVVKVPDINAFWLTSLNLLRFVTWQHLLLLPLLALGIGYAWRKDALVRALAVSFFLPIPVMLILLPYQGHGWGYRYLHGVIGNACLLGGYGWHTLEMQGLSFKRLLIWASAATFLIVLPVRAFMAHRMTWAFVQPARTVARSNADMAIVEDDGVLIYQDLVLNRPDLSNRPIRLEESKLLPSDMAPLCTKGSIAFIEAPRLWPINDLFGWPHTTVSPQMKALEQAAQDAHCNVAPS